MHSDYRVCLSTAVVLPWAYEKGQTEGEGSEKNLFDWKEEKRSMEPLLHMPKDCVESRIGGLLREEGKGNSGSMVQRR